MHYTPHNQNAKLNLPNNISLLIIKTHEQHVSLAPHLRLHVTGLPRNVIYNGRQTILWKEGFTRITSGSKNVSQKTTTITKILLFLTVIYDQIYSEITYLKIQNKHEKKIWLTFSNPIVYKIRNMKVFNPKMKNVKNFQSTLCLFFDSIIFSTRLILLLEFIFICSIQLKNYFYIFYKFLTSMVLTQNLKRYKQILKCTKRN